MVARLLASGGQICRRQVCWRLRGRRQGHDGSNVLLSFQPENIEIHVRPPVGGHDQREGGEGLNSLND